MPRDVFEHALAERGWTPGSNALLEYRDTDREHDVLAEAATELSRLNVDVILTCGGRATRAAQHSTKAIPIVMAATSDPNRSDFFFDMLLRGRRDNVTGVVLLTTEAGPKALELLSEAGGFDRIAILYDNRTPFHSTKLKSVQDAARSLAIQVRPVGVRNLSDLGPAFATMQQENIKALVVLGSPYFFAERGRIVELATRYRLATMFHLRDATEAGGLMSYSPNHAALYRHAAGYVDKVLRGARPADLALQELSEFELVINLKTSKALGLTIPPSVLQRADQLIK